MKVKARIRFGSAVAGSAGRLNLICSLTWGSAALHPRAESPAEHLGWGARLYSVARYRELVERFSVRGEGSSMSARPSLLFVLIWLLSLVNPLSISQSQERRVPVAVLGFGDSQIGRLAAETLAVNLESVRELLVLDRNQTSTAAKGAGQAPSLNMSLEEARGLGAAIGSDYYIVGDAQTLRRSPSMGPPYFESYASVFLVSSRTGRLLIWQRPNFTAATPAAAEKLLLADLSSGATRARNLVAIRQAQDDARRKREIAIETSAPLIETAPDDDKIADAEGLRLPRPFRRLSPPYPETAASAEVEAVVDVLVDLDVNGEVSHAEVARWAGFGLDEATIETVYQLHFFPAMRNGSAIPLRVLLRYNFRKPPK